MGQWPFIFIALLAVSPFICASEPKPFSQNARSSDDPNYTVFKGQLYKVTDLQGYQRSSYDMRGRVVKTGRFLKANSMEYITQTTYDDADRV